MHYNYKSSWSSRKRLVKLVQAPGGEDWNTNPEGRPVAEGRKESAQSTARISTGKELLELAALVIVALEMVNDTADDGCANREDGAERTKLDSIALVNIGLTSEELLEFATLLLITVLEVVDDTANDGRADGEDGTKSAELNGVTLVDIGLTCKELFKLTTLLLVAVVLEVVDNSTDDRCTDGEDGAESTELDSVALAQTSILASQKLLELALVVTRTKQ